MTPFRSPTRILCPTDFSPHSRRALEYAIALARPLAAEIVVLHVCLLPIPCREADDNCVDWMPPERDLRSEMLERVRGFSAPADAAGLPTRLLLREGNPADEILQTARSLHSDLIVMGSHGRRGFERWILGSHAERVLRMATCPVLTISGPVETDCEAAPVQLDEILCATSGTSHSTPTVTYARGLARALGAHLITLHAADPVIASAHAEILRCARKCGSALIVVGAHDRDPGLLGFLGSTSDHVVREATCGVLTVRTSAVAAERSEDAQTVVAAGSRA
jgi:nucleotide-binding universal stress UspA family protein